MKTMSSMKKGIIPASLLIALTGLLTLLVVLLPKLQVANDSQIYGSVSVSNGYLSTSTRSAVLGVALTSPTTLRTGTGLLGSVIITGAGAGQLNLYDGTSTAAHADYATTTLVTFPLSAAAGTYTFDVVFSRGLVYEVVGTAPTSTISFRIE